MIRIWIKNNIGQWQALKDPWEVDEARYWIARIEKLGGEVIFTSPDTSPRGGQQ